MKTLSMKSLSMLVLSGAVGLSLLAGCAATSGKKATESHVVRTAADDTTFAAGAGRAPTATTSYTFAKILVSQGRDRDALYVLARIIRDHPDFLPAYNEMAGIYARADRLDDAVEVLTSGLKKFPHDAVLQNNLGMCYMLRGENAKALETFTQATRAMPANPTFRANRATALALTGDEIEAEREYRTVIGELATLKNLTILSRTRDKQTGSAETPSGDDAPTAESTAAPAAKAEGTSLPL